MVFKTDPVFAGGGADCFRSIPLVQEIYFQHLSCFHVRLFVILPVEQHFFIGGIVYFLSFVNTLMMLILTLIAVWLLRTPEHGHALLGTKA